jgi:hypothetical protein
MYGVDCLNETWLRFYSVTGVFCKIPRGVFENPSNGNAQVIYTFATRILPGAISAQWMSVANRSESTTSPNAGQVLNQQGTTPPTTLFRKYKLIKRLIGLLPFRQFVGMCQETVGSEAWCIIKVSVKVSAVI